MDRRDFVRIGLDASRGDKVAEEPTSRHAECAFGWVQLHLVSAQVGEGLLVVLEESAALFGFDDNVIDVDMHISADLALQAFLHGALVCGTSVFVPHGHACVTVSPIGGNERRFFLDQIS